MHKTSQHRGSKEVHRRRHIDAQDKRAGSLLGLYRHIGENLKVGVGYNFTNFSDDLTDLSFSSQGVFVNFVGKI